MDFVPSQLIFLSILLLLRQQARALNLTVSVPAYLKVGESASLNCRYELGSDKLYSVSWYKDNEHIYKFTESNKEKLVFAVEGVKIDSGRSNNQSLQLTSVNLNSTGHYACEVNTDHLPFEEAKSVAYMEVIHPPNQSPKITGEEKIYASGDILALNCTSDYSHPAAQLQWFINDVPVDPDSEVLHIASQGLRSTRSSLRLELNPLHLADSKIEVKCKSSVRTSKSARTPFEDTRVTKIYVQGHASLSAPSGSLLLVALVLLSLLQKD